ncbi:GNAT family N-acetyltransferase [Paenibacillus thalictri]|uniref:N-acetyltransferase n=1 Tax=Paenibacillus thalictri TaxID=2527873 RepID=A0A4Q9DJL1_9BACL|nr:GNAT family N-acetyltransferase [Paenibacillus thalictri]TBL74524.1 N-acetyltransferase [Paenibacillus thalictri]
MIELNHYRRPDQKVIGEVAELIRLLTGDWFTDLVREEAERDMLFQDVMCLRIDGSVKAFIIFTSWEGIIRISLMGTDPAHQGQGLGSRLMNDFVDHIQTLGFKQIALLTVPPEVRSCYERTIGFYSRHGFIVSNRYKEIRAGGAIQMVRNL